MARKSKAMTRDTMIAMLRTRGVKGRLSKMTKPQLQQMVAKTTPPATSKGHDSNPDRPKGDLELEPDDHSGGHYFRTDGKTVTDGNHSHTTDPWPSYKVTKPKKATNKKKAAKKKVDPIEDPEAELTVTLVNKRLNADRHPATGRKISGKKASEMQFILLGNRMTRLMANDPVNGVDIEQSLDNIDEEHAREFPKDEPPASGIDTANILEHARRRSKPERAHS